MPEIHVSEPEPPEVVHVHEPADTATMAGVNLTLVLIALLVLVGLVALMFYLLPSWLGTTTVNINIRNP